MKKLKNENGVITMITLLTVLFIITFLLSSYIIVANKVKTQKEIINETKKIYKPKYSMEEIYNSYFSNDNVIPIYTDEELIKIGETYTNLNGKYYTNDENTIYVLMNNIEFNATDLELETDWKPIDWNTNFPGTFDWNGKKITVTNIKGNIEFYDGQTRLTEIAYKNLEEDASSDIKTAVDEGKVEKVLKETITLDGKTVEALAVIPTGFTVSTKDGEDSISAGLVVYDGTPDNRNNEFVWIPVDEEFKASYSSGTDYLEPTELTHVSGTSGGNILDSKKCLDYWYGSNYYNFETDFNYILDYSQMVHSVNKYNGFYIGRYETTLDENGKIGSKANTRVFLINDILKEGTNSTSNQPYYYRWWGLYYIQRKSNVAGNGDYVQTNMIWGQQWDEMLKYLGKEQAESTILGTKSYMVNSGTQTYDNGLKDIMNNIYDLRRNVQEMTAEAYSLKNRVLCGRWL